MKRKEAEEKIKALGASAKISVTKDLSYLVTNDPESGSAKNVKARNLGVAIIDEAQFLDLLKESGGGRRQRCRGQENVGRAAFAPNRKTGTRRTLSPFRPL
jgi:BRCT domain type II-containing protein